MHSNNAILNYFWTFQGIQNYVMEEFIGRPPVLMDLETAMPMKVGRKE